MDAPKVVALYSPAPQSGKTTVADALEHAYCNVVRVSFASPLKAMLSAMLKEAGAGRVSIQEMIYGGLKEKPVGILQNKSPRHALQTLGTEWGRNLIGPNLWVDLCIRKIKKSVQEGGLVVVDDMRFPNEYHALREYGAYMVKVVRPQRIVPLSSIHHPSEGGLHMEYFNHVIINDGSLEQLIRSARACAERIW